MGLRLGVDGEDLLLSGLPTLEDDMIGNYYFLMPSREIREDKRYYGT
jgi:hypothetical protein